MILIVLPYFSGSWEYERGINSFMCVFSWDLGFGFAYPRPEIRDKRDKEHLDAFPYVLDTQYIFILSVNSRFSEEKKQV